MWHELVNPCCCFSWHWYTCISMEQRSTAPSVGVSCRLFLLRLYFAQTHSSLAIAARPKSTKLEKNWSFIICDASKILCSVACSHLILWSFFLTPRFCLFCECLKMTANHGYHSIYLIPTGTEEDLFSSMPMVWFWKGQRCKCKDAPSNWLNLPLDIHVCGRWFIISSVVIIIFIIIAFR